MSRRLQTILRRERRRLIWKMGSHKQNDVAHVRITCFCFILCFIYPYLPFEGPLEDVSLCGEDVSERKNSLEGKIREIPDDTTEKRKEETETDDEQPRPKPRCSHSPPLLPPNPPPPPLPPFPPSFSPPFLPMQPSRSFYYGGLPPRSHSPQYHMHSGTEDDCASDRSSALSSSYYPDSGMLV